MAGYWKDFRDRDNSWQGLEFVIQDKPAAGLAMEMLSGHASRMALNAQGTPLFWASVLADHSGVWLVFNADHSCAQALLPPVTSADVETIKKAGPEAWLSQWSRYFAQRLIDSPAALLPARRWLLRPMTQVKPAAPYAINASLPLAQWRFNSPASSQHIWCDWTLYGEDFPNLTNPEKVKLVDWWWGGNLLLGRYAITPEEGRLKWWRKKCREGALPPVLVWYIAGLASFVVLDGHYRLQAAIAEGIAPDFLVLSELSEHDYPLDPEHEARILHALEMQQRKNPQFNVDGTNQTLMNLYDNRYYYAPTHSRAILGNGEAWAQELTAYLQKHGLADAYLEKILQRQE